MNGPQHYRRAERLEQLAVRQFENSDTTEPNPLWQLTIQQAQVHATLALTAATIDAAEYDGQARYDAAAACRPGLLAVRPHPGDEVDPPYPGTPWGRALYGEATR